MGRSGAAAVRLGAQRERQEVAWRQDNGWLAFRTGGHSANRGNADAFDVCDVIAMRAQFKVNLGAEVLMIEVKSTAGGPFERFGPTEREALILAAAVAGATPLLVWWPVRRERIEIPVAKWPLTRND